MAHEQKGGAGNSETETPNRVVILSDTPKL